MRRLATRSFSSFLIVMFWFGGVAVLGVRAGPVTFLNDYEGFLAAAGDVRVIDFETLPDGSPSHVGVPITPHFNYTDQGVTFSSPAGELYISGNPVSGFGLLADAYYEQQRTWIIADLAPGASAVGVFFAGGIILSAFDAHDELIASATYVDAGVPFFVGIVSDRPIASAIADKDNVYSLILDFVYAPVPEPATVVLLLLGTAAIARKRLSINPSMVFP